MSFADQPNIAGHGNNSLTPTPSTALAPTSHGPEESQTQAETQIVARGSVQELKRKLTTANTEMLPKKKKVKISMGPAVDLQD